MCCSIGKDNLVQYFIMPRIKSVDEILDLRLSNNTADKLARRYLVKRVDELIRNGAMEQQDSVTFEVPCMIVFMPMYDRDVLTRALCKHYNKIGFVCEMEEYTLTIGWGMESDDESSTASGGKDDGSVHNPCVEEAMSEEDEPVAIKFSLERPSMAQRVKELKAKKA